MTITHMGVDDDKDVDIVLEEVSKIFRCKECFRCFLSLTKYAEHFPKYHPEQTKQDTSPPERQSPTAVQQTSQNDDQSAKILNKTIVPKPKLKTISLRKFGQSTRKYLEEDERSETSDSTSTTSSDTGNSNNFTETTGENIRTDLISVKNTDNLSSKANAKPQASQPVPVQPNPAIQPSNSKRGGKKRKVAKKSSSSLGKSEKNQQQQGVSNPKEPIFEVITLSDSDDDNDNNNNNANILTSSIQPTVKVKQEIDCSKEDEHGSSAPETNLDGPLVTKESNVVEPEAVNDDELSKPFEKNYSCQYCTKVFTRDRTLQSHIKGMHRAEMEAENNGKSGQNQQSETKKRGKLAGPTTSTSQSNAAKTVSDKPVTRKRGRKPKKAKQQKKLKIDPELEKILDQNMGESQPAPAFSCKWCPKKFETLDALKEHAINLHIKYKAPE